MATLQGLIQSQASTIAALQVGVSNMGGGLEGGRGWHLPECDRVLLASDSCPILKYQPYKG